MASVLDFINRVRTLIDLPETAAVVITGTDPGSDDNCVVAQALGVSIGESEAEGSGEHWVMRFTDRLVARRVGIVMGLRWTADPPEVELPSPIVDLAVSQHFGVLEVDDVGFLRGWWVPAASDHREDMRATEWELFTPRDDLIDGRPWVYGNAM